jgi:hypothetical protein
LTSDTSATAIISGMIVPKSPREPASSERENFIGVAGCGDTVRDDGDQEIILFNDIHGARQLPSRNIFKNRLPIIKIK